MLCWLDEPFPFGILEYGYQLVLFWMVLFPLQTHKCEMIFRWCLPKKGDIHSYAQ